MQGIDFEDIVMKSPAAVYIHDENFKTVFINQIAERATKYSRDELIGDSILKLAYDEDLPKVIEAGKRALSGEEVIYEARYVRKDGKVKWVMGFTRPITINGRVHVLGNWIDITKVKELEEKLKESEEFYRSLIEDSLNPVYVVQNNKFVYVNRAFEKFTGYRKGEILGRGAFSLVHPSDRDLVYSRYIERERGKRDTETYSFRIVAKDGEIKWATVRPSRITYKGRPAVAATLVDTTEIYGLNERLRIREEYLRLLNKILRHDIANALVLVRAVLEDREDEMSKKALNRVDHIVKLIREVAGLESALEELKPVSLYSVAKEIAEDFGVEVKGNDVIVMANDGLRTVVFNLIQNAIQHSDGEVWVEVGRDGNWGVLKVVDNGKGIPDEIKDRIFDEGVTTGGGGVGLFIVRKMVEILNGLVTFYDNKPRGTVFEVRLRG